jgi:hypothetical protein
MPQLVLQSCLEALQTHEVEQGAQFLRMLEAQFFCLRMPQRHDLLAGHGLRREVSRSLKNFVKKDRRDLLYGATGLFSLTRSKTLTIVCILR